MIQRICCKNVNCYVVSNGKDAILVDTGRKKCRQRILNACRPYNVRLLVLTHGHVDHVQNAAFLSEVFGCPVAMSEADVSLLSDNMRQPLKAQGIFGKLFLAASVRNFQKDEIPLFTPDIFLKEGDSLEAYGVPAKIISLPGHTKGSVGIDIMGKDLIVGDALMNMLYPTVSMLYHDEAAMRQSTDKIGKLGKRRIYFGHGKPRLMKRSHERSLFAAP